MDARVVGIYTSNAMRYGTVPVVHATGGLKDTVPPADEHGKGGLGFTFQSYNGDDFLAALKRAIALYRDDPAGFQDLQRRGMEQGPARRAIYGAVPADDRQPLTAKFCDPAPVGAGSFSLKERVCVSFSTVNRLPTNPPLAP